jgi:hypothetical protein
VSPLRFYDLDEARFMLTPRQLARLEPGNLRREFETLVHRVLDLPSEVVERARRCLSPALDRDP